MRAVSSLMFLAGTIMISSCASAADLPIRLKPAIHREDSSKQEERRLFERFLEYLRERRSN